MGWAGRFLCLWKIFSYDGGICSTEILFLYPWHCWGPSLNMCHPPTSDYYSSPSNLVSPVRATYQPFIAISSTWTRTSKGLHPASVSVLLCFWSILAIHTAVPTFRCLCLIFQLCLCQAGNLLLNYSCPTFCNLKGRELEFLSCCWHHYPLKQVWARCQLWSTSGPPSKFVVTISIIK